MNDDILLKSVRRVRFVYKLIGVSLLFLATSILFVIATVSSVDNPSHFQLPKQMAALLVVVVPAWSIATQYFFNGYRMGVFMSARHTPLERLQSAFIFRLVMLVPLAAFSLTTLMLASVAGALKESPYLWLLLVPFLGLIEFMRRTYPTPEQFGVYIKQGGT